jgi:hypothetical protein
MTLREVILRKMAGGVNYSVLDVVTAIASDPETREFAWTSDIIDTLESLAEEGRIHKVSDDGMHLTRVYVSFDMVSP